MATPICAVALASWRSASATSGRRRSSSIGSPGWMRAGKLKTREDIVEGLQTFPDTLLKLFRGENNGKLLLKVAEK